MADELTLFPLEFNRSIRIEARDEHLSADPGTILVREAMAGIDDYEESMSDFETVGGAKADAYSW